MIRLQRPLAPDALNTPAVADTLNVMRAKVQAGERVVSKDFRPYWSAQGVKDALFHMHTGKCCYCERRRDKAREPDVEHFRPKAKVKENPAHPGYWWLAYEWENLLWSCKACNEEFKLNQFPLSNEPSRVSDESGNLDIEDTLLLNPASDDCESHFVYDWTSAPDLEVSINEKHGNEKAKASIDVLGLNRLDLLRQRSDHIKYTLRSIAQGLIAYRTLGSSPDNKKALVKQLKETVSPEFQFSGLAKAYFTALGLTDYME